MAVCVRVKLCVRKHVTWKEKERALRVLVCGGPWLYTTAAEDAALMNTACHSPPPSFTALLPSLPAMDQRTLIKMGFPFCLSFSYSCLLYISNQGVSRSVEASDPRLSLLSSSATTAQKSQPLLRCLNQKIPRNKSKCRLALQELELDAQLFKAEMKH